jgi:restriction system protein
MVWNSTMRETTAAELRDVVAEVLASTIEMHRASREAAEDASYERPTGEPTDEEIDDFLFHNPILEEETVDQLTNPGLLGFAAKTARATDEWISEFRENLDAWADSASWLAADFPWRSLAPRHHLEPVDSEIWRPSSTPQPPWLVGTPAGLLVAASLLKQGRHLSEMSWREFEELVGNLLEAEGWAVDVTRPSRDGGFDVRATKSDDVLGDLTSLWQAKRYRDPNKVRLHEVRELSAVREEIRASKAMIVTTSRLTRDAISWIRRDRYRLGYKEYDHMLQWIKGVLLR